jgi:cholinesterase
VGAQHFVNVVFSFRKSLHFLSSISNTLPENISGALGPLPKYQNYTNLSRNIRKACISVND